MAMAMGAPRRSADRRGVATLRTPPPPSKHTLTTLPVCHDFDATAA
jgi:hypothetical protein